jgi:hypothetical protein
MCSTIEKDQGRVGKHYRQIYKECYGDIPMDDQGRTFDIHHIDGNRKNNDPKNLVALSLEEHYDVHYRQGDFQACHRIAGRFDNSKELLSELASKFNAIKVANRTHHFLGGEISRKNNARRVEEGTHNFLDGDWASERELKKIREGTHRFCSSEYQKQVAMKQIQNGNHPSQVERTCPVCGKTGKGTMMLRWHFDNCREK